MTSWCRAAWDKSIIRTLKGLVVLFFFNRKSLKQHSGKHRSINQSVTTGGGLRPLNRNTGRCFDKEFIFPLSRLAQSWAPCARGRKRLVRNNYRCFACGLGHLPLCQIVAANAPDLASATEICPSDLVSRPCAMCTERNSAVCVSENAPTNLRWAHTHTHHKHAHCMMAKRILWDRSEPFMWN